MDIHNLKPVTLDTEVNSQIKSQNVTIPTSKSLQPKVPIEKAHKYDIGLYVSKIESMSEEDVYDLIQNVWVPTDDYEFPYTKSRKYSQDWLRLYRWCFLSSMCFTWSSFIPNIDAVKFVHCSA